MQEYTFVRADAPAADGQSRQAGHRRPSRDSGQMRGQLTPGSAADVGNTNTSISYAPWGHAGNPIPQPAAHSPTASSSLASSQQQLAPNGPGSSPSYESPTQNEYFPATQAHAAPRPGPGANTTDKPPSAPASHQRRPPLQYPYSGLVSIVPSQDAAPGLRTAAPVHSLPPGYTVPQASQQPLTSASLPIASAAQNSPPQPNVGPPKATSATATAPPTPTAPPLSPTAPTAATANPAPGSPEGTVRMAFVRRLREYEARIVAAHDAIAQIRERGSRWEQQARAWYTRAEAAQAHAQEAETRAQKADAHAQKADAHAKEVDARAREALRELLGKAERAQGEMAGLRKALADAEQRAGAGAAQVEDARTESTELRRIVSEHDAARRQAEEVLASVKQQLAKVERDRQMLEGQHREVENALVSRLATIEADMQNLKLQYESELRAARAQIADAEMARTQLQCDLSCTQLELQTKDVHLEFEKERCEAQLAHIAELEAGYMHQHDEAEARVRQLDEVAAEAIRMHDEADTRALEAEALRTELTRVEAGINDREAELRRALAAREAEAAEAEARERKLEARVGEMNAEIERLNKDAESARGEARMLADQLQLQLQSQDAQKHVDMDTSEATEEPDQRSDAMMKNLSRYYDLSSPWAPREQPGSIYVERSTDDIIELCEVNNSIQSPTEAEETGAGETEAEQSVVAESGDQPHETSRKAEQDDEDDPDIPLKLLRRSRRAKRTVESEVDANIWQQSTPEDFTPPGNTISQGTRPSIRDDAAIAPTYTDDDDRCPTAPTTDAKQGILVDGTNGKKLSKRAKKHKRHNWLFVDVPPLDGPRDVTPTTDGVSEAPPQKKHRRKLTLKFDGQAVVRT